MCGIASSTKFKHLQPPCRFPDGTKQIDMDVLATWLLVGFSLDALVHTVQILVGSDYCTQNFLLSNVRGLTDVETPSFV